MIGLFGAGFLETEEGYDLHGIDFVESKDERAVQLYQRLSTNKAACRRSIEPSLSGCHVVRSTTHDVEILGKYCVEAGTVGACWEPLQSRMCNYQLSLHE
ncbi:hypothetical protein M758_10G052000 [Ceratodon purpureus]|nr:hypothetical protein M758_10G052000 [Ceratodon purpureus]